MEPKKENFFEKHQYLEKLLIKHYNNHIDKIDMDINKYLILIHRIIFNLSESSDARIAKQVEEMFSILIENSVKMDNNTILFKTLTYFIQDGFDLFVEILKSKDKVTSKKKFNTQLLKLMNSKEIAKLFNLNEKDIEKELNISAFKKSFNMLNNKFVNKLFIFPIYFLSAFIHENDLKNKINKYIDQQYIDQFYQSYNEAILEQKYEALKEIINSETNEEQNEIENSESNREKNEVTNEINNENKNENKNEIKNEIANEINENKNEKKKENQAEITNENKKEIKENNLGETNKGKESETKQNSENSSDKERDKNESSEDFNKSEVKIISSNEKLYIHQENINNKGQGDNTGYTKEEINKMIGSLTKKFEEENKKLSKELEENKKLSQKCEEENKKLSKELEENKKLSQKCEEENKKLSK